jgi:hypothetical protein
MHGVVRWILLAAIFAASLAAQNAAITGSVRDAADAVIPEVAVALINVDTQITLRTTTDATGNYEFPGLRPGTYSVKAERQGFKAFVQANVALEVDQRARLDIKLELGSTTETITVAESTLAVQTDTSSLGEVMDTKKIVDAPLNGRFFLDLALLTPGTVVPSTNNRTFLASPSGIGATGINASGAREDSTNYLFDGINLSDAVQNQITFQPNIDMIREFKVQTNSFSAEYGRNAGIIINVVSKSGTNRLHGTAYEFVRNEKFDAKNYFDAGNQPIPPFKRNIFGYAVGGPVFRNRTFFFHSYEGRRGRESVSLRTPVPTVQQRAAVTHPVVRRLIELIPEPNSGSFFVGSAPKKRTLNQFSGRIDHLINERNFVAGTYILNKDSRTEPTLQGNNLPGFGDTRPARRQLLSLSYTTSISSRITNELRAGLNRVRIDFLGDASQNPRDFGMETGVSIFPNILVTGGPIFGGILGFPQGRGDTTFQYTDVLTWTRGPHSLKFGGEARRFRNNNFNESVGGRISFPSLVEFLVGRPSMTTQQRAPISPAIRNVALNFFVQDDYKIKPRLTLNVGLRYEYNGVPNEIHDRLSLFDFSSGTLMPAEGREVYAKEYNNVGPRVGFSYDPFGAGRTVLRGGFGIYYDQPVTNLVFALGNNPPFSTTVTFTDSAQNPLNINLAAPYSLPGGTPSVFDVNALDPTFRSGYVEQYNFNIQHEQWNTVFQAAYVGSSGRKLRLLREYNQGIRGTRPNPRFGQINLNESSSRSNYNALWLSANRRFSRGMTFTTAYTFSKSIDLNSVGSANPQVQNAYDLNAEKALSDFDARHRLVFSGVFLMPFSARNAWGRVVEGWSLAPILNLQSGNPFSPIVTQLRSGSLRAFDRPDVVAGQSLAIDNPKPERWFNIAAFALNPIGQFGNAGRNILTAPGFADIDLALLKDTRIGEGVSVQFRAEAFNLFNHPNFAQPQNAANVGTFGQITVTRTVRGDLGSSRQIQLGLKFVF